MDDGRKSVVVVLPTAAEGLEVEEGGLSELPDGVDVQDGVEGAVAVGQDDTHLKIEDWSKRYPIGGL